MSNLIEITTVKQWNESLRQGTATGKTVAVYASKPALRAHIGHCALSEMSESTRADKARPAYAQ